MLVKEFIADSFEKRALRNVFGMSGANIEDLYFEISRRKKIKIILAKNEYNAGMMALGSYLADKKVAVVMTTSGAGVLNMVPVLAEAYSSEVPLVLIAGAISNELQGQGGFQDTSGLGDTLELQNILKSCTSSSVHLESGDQIPSALDQAFESARTTRRPSVIVIPKNILNQKILAAPKARTSAFENRLESKSPIVANFANIQKHLFDGTSPTLLVLGEELLHLKNPASVAGFANALGPQTKVAAVPVAKGIFDHRNTNFVGVTGVMGQEAFQSHVKNCKRIVFLGTKMDVLSRFDFLEHIDPSHELVFLNQKKRDFGFFKNSASKQEFVGDLDALLDVFIRNPAPPVASECKVVSEGIGEDQNEFGFRSSISVLQKFVRESDQIFVDAGNTGAFVTHGLKTYGGSLFYISLGMGGMGNSIGSAIGATVANGKRSFVFVGDGSFLMYGLELHTAIEHRLPIVFVVFNNNSHGMCETREQVFLGEQSGINHFRKCFYAEGFQRIFPELKAYEVNTIQQLTTSLQTIDLELGPCLISLNLNNHEFPPFKSFPHKELSHARN